MLSQTRHLPIAMPDIALAALGQVCTISRARDQTLFHQGDVAGAIYQVQSGCIRLQTLTQSGRRCVTAFQHGGEMFGLGAQGPSQVDAQAVVASCVVRLCPDQLSTLLSRQPELALRVLDAAYGGQEPVAQHLVTIATAPAEQRVARFLVSLTGKLGQWVGRHRVLELPMMRADIADHLGLSFETLSREMTKLHERGVIERLNARQLRITSPTTLKSLSQSTPPQPISSKQILRVPVQSVQMVAPLFG